MHLLLLFLYLLEADVLEVSAEEALAAVEDSAEEALAAVQDIGEITARTVRAYFDLPETRALFGKLKAAGVVTALPEREQNPAADSGGEEGPGVFAGMTFVLTGTLPTMTRPEATEIIKKHGGKATGSVSKKTTYVLAGADTGSKLAKANELGIPVIGEDEFLAMLKGE